LALQGVASLLEMLMEFSGLCLPTPALSLLINLLTAFGHPMVVRQKTESQENHFSLPTGELCYMNLTVRDLFDAGVHFGHQIRRWNPRSKAFIHGHVHGISIIDLEKTYEQLESASRFLEDLVAKGKDVLFVGTKKQAKDIIRESAVSVGMPFSVNRWMGGTLTNFVTIKSSLSKYHRFLEMEADGRMAKLPGKESAAIRRQMERMFRNFEGLKEVRDLPAAMFVVDTKAENIAITEARILGIPVVGLVDTNADPTLLDYPIPGNDDAVKSIRIIVDAITEAVQNGLARRSVSYSQRGFTPRSRDRDFSSDHESGVTLPAGFEEYSDEAPAAVVNDAVDASEEGQVR
jgi:small subunit ribosomal protein S2